MRMLASGYLGIGLTSPIAQLDVRGSGGPLLNIEGSDEASRLYITSSGNVGVGYGNITPSAMLDVTNYVVQNSPVVVFTGYDTNTQSLKFYPDLSEGHLTQLSATMTWV